MRLGIPESMLDPVEQARADGAAGRNLDPEDVPRLLEEWGPEGFRAYSRELRGWRPAQAPLPWPVVIALLAVEAAVAELSLFLDSRWRRRSVLLLGAAPALLAGLAVAKWQDGAAEAAARRRGVTRARDAPPEPLRAPRMIVALGGIAGYYWLRLRGVRNPRGTGAPAAILSRLVLEIEHRRRWRGWVPPSARR
jgi:hypothetical protein